MALARPQASQTRDAGGGGGAADGAEARERALHLAARAAGLESQLLQQRALGDQQRAQISQQRAQLERAQAALDQQRAAEQQPRGRQAAGGPLSRGGSAQLGADSDLLPPPPAHAAALRGRCEQLAAQAASLQAQLDDARAAHGARLEAEARRAGALQRERDELARELEGRTAELQQWQVHAQVRLLVARGRPR